MSRAQDPPGTDPQGAPAVHLPVSAVLADALRAGTRHLGRAEARILLARVLACRPEWLLAHDDAPLTVEQAQRYSQALAARLQGQPIAYLTGQREFHGRDFLVSPAVLIPRPETERLVDLALDWLRAHPHPMPAVIDLGTGSGVIALSLAASLPALQPVATDASADALAVARQNAQNLNVADRVTFLCGDWWQAVPGVARFDLIVSNPPYIAGSDRHLEQGDLRFEPRRALTPEGDGLDALRTIVRSAPQRLQPGGRIILEHGYDQGPACQTLLKEAGLTGIHTVHDAAGLPRLTLGDQPGTARTPAPAGV